MPYLRIVEKNQPVKLLTLLKALRKDEYREFEKFLQSPYFKSSDQYLTFFRYLYKRYPAFELEREDLEACYRNCFGAKSFTETKLYNLTSGMAKQVEQYLAVNLVLTQVETQGMSYQQYLLVRALGERNMSNYFRMETDRLSAYTASIPAKTEDDYLTLYLLKRNFYYNPDTPKLQNDQYILQSATDNLVIHFCISYLRFIAETKVRGRFISDPHESSILEAVLGYTDIAEIWKAHPLAAVYNSLVKLYQQGVSEQGFRYIKELMVERFEQLPKQEQRLLLAHIINVGISLNSTVVDVNKELLSLYKLAISANALLEGNRITHIAFFNITAAAAHCKEFEWAMDFVDKYSIFLEVDKELFTVNLAKAFIYYEQGNLQAADSHFDTYVFRINGFELSGRLLHLKLIYEKYLINSGEFQFLSNTINGFEKYIEDKKMIPTDKKEAILNCIRFIRNLAKEKNASPRLSAKTSLKLHKKLNETSNIILKDWLQMQISRL